MSKTKSTLKSFALIVLDYANKAENWEPIVIEATSQAAAYEIAIKEHVSADCNPSFFLIPVEGFYYSSFFKPATFKADPDNA